MTAEVRVPNRRGEGIRLRGEILAAAEALLEETSNEAAVTLRAVARRAGISAPSIYAHFADRQAILLGVVQGAFAELADRLREAGADGPSDDDPDPDAGDPTALVLATGDAYLAYAAARPQRYRLMFDGVWDGREAVATSSVTADEVTGLGDEALTLLADRLQACVDAGVSGSTDPQADAVALWLGLHGLAHQRAVAPAFPWPADVVARVVRPLARLDPLPGGRPETPGSRPPWARQGSRTVPVEPGAGPSGPTHSKERDVSAPPEVEHGAAPSRRQRGQEL